ncbi:MAG: PHP domain-containing protein [Anaerolineae bacterium]|nr:PHP domain-containing protein [Anaerolineae bacterium]
MTSDGTLTPSEVVRLALARGLRVIALTDHDTMGGVAEAQTAAAGMGLEVISGVEINAEGDGTALHILGFYVDPQAPFLDEKLRTLRDARLGRARKMLERLGEMGMPLDWEEVQALAGGESIGRPHVARAMLDQGYVETVKEAFERFIGPGGPAHIPRLRLSPAETIGAIVEAGGVPVLAHPAHSGPAVVARLPEFVGYGLRGLEVYYPRHSPDEVEMLLRLCREHGLIATGGTDFHGPDSEEGAPLGSIYVPPECVERLRAAATGEVGRVTAPLE